MAKKQGIALTGAVYRSGAVARLTGIPVETLRVWERRYKVVGPRQSPSGQRYYRPEEVTRLGVIKQLVDSGHAIGSIAALRTAQLRAMLDKAARSALAAPARAGARGARTPRALRIAIVGEALALRVQRRLPRDLRVVATSPDPERAARSLRGISAEVLLIELPTLQAESPEVIRALAMQLGARRIVVEYGCGLRRIEQELAGRGWALARAPLEGAQLAYLCGLPASPPQTAASAQPASMQPPAPPRFDGKALAEMSMVSVALKCECPRHVADLLVRLGNFETYCAECEARNPGDAALHQFLGQVTGNARALMEAALTRIAEAESIPLPA